ncbi:MAG TPA: phosphopantothenate/pantothenate synthetase [Candidatus Thalassarchaeaceae archaeon]|nr:MAG TPA: phosphopantothenate/pantothenate synthetase [Candidatus Poseidoniales archaeon]HII35130.1 phosphopantothenate/pantothenate synthetase [Candidatus Thalassarchaeaceae archaeon]
MAEIPDSHPRKSSLMSRQRMVEASRRGLLAESAMIAHGRGEAFDYLLGERTSDSASLAIREAAARLLEADSPIISMNGNSTVLAGAEAIKIAAILGCSVEVNIYYRTERRMESLISELEAMKELLIRDASDSKRESIVEVEILGAEADGRIQGLEGPRALCSARGIERADVVLVPLEDGDRCEALTSLGKQVIAVDLNPLSRTSRKATVTIVDEVSRAFRKLISELSENPKSTDWDNDSSLVEALEIMSSSSLRID